MEGFKIGFKAKIRNILNMIMMLIYNTKMKFHNAPSYMMERF